MCEPRLLPQVYEHAAEYRSGPSGPAGTVDGDARARGESLEHAIHLPAHESQLGRQILRRSAVDQVLELDSPDDLER